MNPTADGAREFEVPAECGGERLDRFLTARLDDFTRSAIRRMIDAGRVLVDGEAALKAGQALEPGDTVEVDLPSAAPALAEPDREVVFGVLHEDDDVVVVDKPSGLVVHAGHGNLTGTLVNGLLGRGIGLSAIGGPDRPGIVHRLDQHTSGVMVVAKTDAAHLRLAEAFADREVVKTYHALVWGRPDPSAGVVDRAIGRSSRDRTRMAIGVRGGRLAVTHYCTIETPPGFAWLEIGLETGRTHQIRVHLQSIGHPVVGDERYGGVLWKSVQDPVRRKALKSFLRHALHAARLEFTHPATGERVCFEAPLPPEIESLLEALRRVA